MRLTVMGTGYVGLVSAVGFAEQGHHVTCVDLDREKVEAVQRGIPPFFEPGLEDALVRLRTSGNIDATTDVNDTASDSDIILLAVGTPADERGMDLTALLAAAGDVGSALAGSSRYHVVGVKSTIVPGTTEDRVAPIVREASGLGPQSLGFCVNPEFLREGSALEDFREPDRIVIGEVDKRSGDVIESLHSSFNCAVLRTSTRNAELIKCVNNALLATLVSFSNEVAAICENFSGTDEDTVLEGVRLDARLRCGARSSAVAVGIAHYLSAGIGFGGSCLPKDIEALAAFARENEMRAPLLNAVIEINERRVKDVVDWVQNRIGDLKGKRLAVLGLVFKPGTDDLRRSASVRIALECSNRGAETVAFDPMIATPPTDWGERIRLVRSVDAALEGADAAILATAWPEFKAIDWPIAVRSMRTPLIVDGRKVVPIPTDRDGYEVIRVGKRG